MNFYYPKSNKNFLFVNISLSSAVCATEIPTLLSPFATSIEIFITPLFTTAFTVSYDTGTTYSTESTLE